MAPGTGSTVLMISSPPSAQAQSFDGLDSGIGVNLKIE